MDRINGLPDEVLVKILTFLPTKKAVSTSILSKRWEFLWMWLPRLDYFNDITKLGTRHLIRDFVEKTLPLHRAPVIECLRIGLSPTFEPKDFIRWIDINWSQYSGKPQERDIAVYILKNARHLKKATILADTDEHGVSNLQMIKELTLSPRASSTCQLVFVEDLKSFV